MAILITAKRDGFRRLGIAHSAQGTAYPDDRFTPAQLAVLKAEPMLVVEEGAEVDLEQELSDENRNPKSAARAAKAAKDTSPSTAAPAVPTAPAVTQDKAKDGAKDADVEGKAKDASKDSATNSSDDGAAKQ